jgi:membrane protein DedA with SNARE-associated domain
MPSSQEKSLLPIAMLVAALLIWAGLFALGAYLELGADQPRHDVRKPLIIMATMAAFLTLWGITVWVQSRRPRR